MSFDGPLHIAKLIDWTALALVIGIGAKFVPAVAGLFTIAWHVYRFYKVRQWEKEQGFDPRSL